MCEPMRFVQKASRLTTVLEVDKAYGVLTLIVFNIVPFRSYTLRPTFLPLLQTFIRKWDVGVWTGLSWLKIGTGWQALVNVVLNLLVP